MTSREKAAETPKGTGRRTKARKAPTPKRINLLERARRARRIGEARLKPSPDTWDAISKREGLSKSACEDLFADFLQWPTAHLEDPVRVVDATLDTIEASIGAISHVLDEAHAQGNVNGQIGAIRLLFEANASRWDVARTAGRMPQSIVAWQQAVETRQILDQFMAVLNRRDDLPDGLIAELEEVLTRFPVNGSAPNE